MRLETGEDLREYFAGRLPARLAEIEDACRAARNAGWTGEPLRTFHRLVHSLAGAGTTFGFPGVSETARGLERLLEGLLQGGAPPGDEETREIAALLSRLREAP
ncbi:MAG TPA: Hpt domain-containing protein [Thermoanaerobaculia bacterium]|nr:Hpt domain-containing protein [Thermoanaerobaculia bacterium]